MNREELLEKIAPCSLMCHTCGAYENGAVCRLSNELLNYMEGVYEFYDKHLPAERRDYLPRLKVFQEELVHYGSPACGGCRNGVHNGCTIENCFILDCVKKHDADYCGVCAEFPCEKTKEIFEEEVYMQWREGNEQIRESGIEYYWETHKGRSHYRKYTKMVVENGEGNENDS